MQEKIRKCETRQFKVIFPGTLNDHDTLFGGTAMKWMDEVAYITAVRFLKQRMVTVSVEKIHFLSPLKSGTIAEITGIIYKTNGATLEVKVEVFVEEMYEIKRYKAIDALFVFAAVDNNHKPTRIKSFEAGVFDD